MNGLFGYVVYFKSYDGKSSEQTLPKVYAYVTKLLSNTINQYFALNYSLHTVAIDLI